MPLVVVPDLASGFGEHGLDGQQVLHLSRLEDAALWVDQGDALASVVEAGLQFGRGQVVMHLNKSAHVFERSPADQRVVLGVVDQGHCSTLSVIVAPHGIGFSVRGGIDRRAICAHGTHLDRVPGCSWYTEGGCCADKLPCRYMNTLHPKKLHLSKWTAVKPVTKEKHFLVAKVVLPEPPDTVIEFVDLEAVHSKSVRRIAWLDLRDQAHWRQGWV